MVGHELAIEVEHPQERLQLRRLSWNWNLLNGLNLCFDWVEPFIVNAVPQAIQNGPHDWHFSALRRKPTLERRSKTLSMLSTCSSDPGPGMRMLSSWPLVEGIPCSRPSIVLWKMPGAEETPYRRRLYLIHKHLLIGLAHV